MPRQTVESLWDKIKVRSLDECWPWKRYCGSGGYGTAGWGGKTYRAHRVALWTLGLLDSPTAPEDTPGAEGFALHTCDNPPCCNPTHFEIGTKSKNAIDAFDHGLSKQGHEHKSAKLTKNQVLAIRKHRGESQYKLARKYGVNQSVISRVQTYETYRNIACL
jgi:hypothetical protein